MHSDYEMHGMKLNQKSLKSIIYLQCAPLCLIVILITIL